ncbi:arginase family protein [Sphingomonas psychrotolerans]|uniref:Arginase family protein n=1 Tax=Sphingomonas psychrotolerans TaxID=1327635 RepID=A0ABU3MZN5_9SPHN|nr:arginase family protein [Sphingomonas psychrotolerans]MDT8757750.1 arginase family protein [Sphingomonas psychrotolerans]
MAPTNLGLRPLKAHTQPGAWRAPEVLRAAGLAPAVRASQIIQMDRPSYRFDEEAGTRIRNGHGIRAFSEMLGAHVATVLKVGAFPLVIGGDCSILLGCLLGARALGRIGLFHVDGHSDFYHPGNYDSEERLGSVAGMDLALATGRGEPLLALWNAGSLVEDRFVVQIGERERLRPGVDYGDIVRTQIRRLPIRRILKHGIEGTVRDALSPVDGERRPMWLHVDLDVLDQRVMPAVDSPGSPGLAFPQLGALIDGLVAGRRVIGADVAIYDPELDPDGAYARGIVACLARGFANLRASK